MAAVNAAASSVAIGNLPGAGAGAGAGAPAEADAEAVPEGAEPVGRVLRPPVPDMAGSFTSRGSSSGTVDDRLFGGSLNSPFGSRDLGEFAFGLLLLGDGKLLSEAMWDLLGESGLTETHRGGGVPTGSSNDDCGSGLNGFLKMKSSIHGKKAVAQKMSSHLKATTMGS